MADANTADIVDFLERHTRTYMVAGYSQEPYPDYYAHEPRSAQPWTPPLAGHGLLDEAQYPHYADHSQYGYGLADDDHDDDDAQSAYTTAPTVTTTHSTNRSAPSNFSTRTYATTPSTAPSLRNNNIPPHHLPFHQQFAHHHPHPPARPGQLLGCEFAPLTGCPATFSLANEDEAAWITHHAQHHLHDSFPALLMCWFCDHVPFVADGGGGYANLVVRMQHVREHILGDHRLTARDMRQDFHVVKHVWSGGRLSEREYRAAMEYDETPEVFRLPGTTGGRRGEGGLRRVEKGERERAQYYDLDKEKRRLERRLKGGRGR
jgi:hypothetical protein